MNLSLRRKWCRSVLASSAMVLLCCDVASAQVAVAAACTTASSAWATGWAIGKGATEALATQEALRTCDRSVNLQGCCQIIGRPVYQGCIALAQSESARSVGYGRTQLEAVGQAVDLCARNSSLQCRLMGAECVP
jgi:hypothetical protein